MENHGVEFVNPVIEQARKIFNWSRKNKYDVFSFSICCDAFRGEAEYKNPEGMQQKRELVEKALFWLASVKYAEKLSPSKVTDRCGKHSLKNSWRITKYGKTVSKFTDLLVAIGGESIKASKENTNFSTSSAPLANGAERLLQTRKEIIQWVAQRGGKWFFTALMLQELAQTPESKLLVAATFKKMCDEKMFLRYGARTKYIPLGLQFTEAWTINYRLPIHRVPEEWAGIISAHFNNYLSTGTIKQAAKGTALLSAPIRNQPTPKNEKEVAPKLSIPYPPLDEELLKTHVVVVESSKDETGNMVTLITYTPVTSVKKVGDAIEQIPELIPLQENCVSTQGTPIVDPPVMTLSQQVQPIIKKRNLFHRIGDWVSRTTEGEK